jgi:hypothetical protein
MIIVNMQPIAGRNEGAAGYNQKRVNAIQALSKLPIAHSASLHFLSSPGIVLQSNTFARRGKIRAS